MVSICFCLSILVLAVCIVSVFIHGMLTKIAEVLYSIYSVLQDINGKLPDRDELRKDRRIGF